MALPSFPMTSASFYVLDISIPNLGTAAILERLTALIAKHEKPCLRGLLGNNLYDAFIIEDSSRMDLIKSGAKWTDSYGRKWVWPGIVHDTNQSLLAYYVYYKFKSMEATHTTGVGTTTSKAEASVSVSPMDKMVNSWNVFSEYASSLLSFLWNYQVDGERVFPEFDHENYCDAAFFSEKINMFGL